MRRAVIMAHFDRDGLLDPHVQATLASVRSLSARIVLVSTGLHPAGAAAAASCGVDDVIVRPNAGHDFQSYAVGLARADPSRFDEVIVINDSVYLAWPDALPRGIARMARHACDVWSATQSREYRFHLQSYCVAFRGRAIASDWFRAFWGAVRPDADRAHVIAHQELALADGARAAGLRVDALWPAPRTGPLLRAVAAWPAQARASGVRRALETLPAAVARDEAGNPTLCDWRRTARRTGLIKVELLCRNPRGDDLADLPRVMEPACLARAQAHARRLHGPSAPAAGRLGA